jgi:hypothetical protein
MPALKVLWSLVILALALLYLAGTIQFGIRFSNLTHRGILTNGPYRWLKHPAYFAKNINWWLISLPFLSTAGITEAVRLSLLLTGVNIIYYLRAKTEEAHLSIDPIYLQYLDFMRHNDLFAHARNASRWCWAGFFGKQARREPHAALGEQVVPNLRNTVSRPD